MMQKLCKGAIILMLASTHQGFAQEPPIPSPGEKALPDDYQAAPQQPDGAAPPQTLSNEELAERLERCRGVLRPPPVGDGGVVQPPPDTGTTPVIPPSALPEQPPAQK